MAAVSLFWDTNMTAMTSCENTTAFEHKKFFLKRAFFVMNADENELNVTYSLRANPLS